ncbi:hypothetical protein KGM_200159 [Danaus plexippus plexippus]|uniref:Uncharacterized protein n=1 Tax=Danaus plexippus plexippus TaxID=278856 RepID=A0A212EUP4_DANPL|nr:hypothetical protein KGM_200159 [Danaus plexippus plexippus]
MSNIRAPVCAALVQSPHTPHKLSSSRQNTNKNISGPHLMRYRPKHKLPYYLPHGRGLSRITSDTSNIPRRCLRYNGPREGAARNDADRERRARGDWEARARAAEADATRLTGKLHAAQREIAR